MTNTQKQIATLDETKAKAILDKIKAKLDDCHYGESGFKFKGASALTAVIPMPISAIIAFANPQFFKPYNDLNYRVEHFDKVFAYLVDEVAQLGDLQEACERTQNLIGKITLGTDPQALELGEPCSMSEMYNLVSSTDFQNVRAYLDKHIDDLDGLLPLAISTITKMGEILAGENANFQDKFMAGFALLAVAIGSNPLGSKRSFYCALDVLSALLKTKASSADMDALKYVVVNATTDLNVYLDVAEFCRVSGEYTLSNVRLLMAYKMSQ